MTAANRAVEKMKENHNNEYIVGSTSVVLCKYNYDITLKTNSKTCFSSNSQHLKAIKTSKKDQLFKYFYFILNIYFF